MTDAQLANLLADAARAAILPRFRRTATEWKPDASPVTEADRAAEAAMRALVAEHRPHDGVIGEEYGDDRPDAPRVWVFDPIDGTRAFVAGRATFTTLIALMVEGEPALGVIDQAGGERWVGDNRESTLNGQPVRCRPCPALSAAHIATTSPAAFSPAGGRAFDRLSCNARDTLWGGDAHNYALLASGHLDAVAEEGLKLHDWAALQPVVRGAGGVFTGWAGGPVLGDGRALAAGDARTHADMLARL
jgi:histidinol phosphatase-like enzyme (inositol monophosphatase family)